METERPTHPQPREVTRLRGRERIEHFSEDCRVSTPNSVAQLLFPHVLATAVTLWFAVRVTSSASGKAWAAFLGIAVTLNLGALLDRPLRLAMKRFLSGQVLVIYGLGLAAGSAGLAVWAGSIPAWSLLIPFVSAGLAAGLLAAIMRGADTAIGGGRLEMLRAAAVALFALWVIAPFASTSQVGAGDALHYVRQLADFIDQLEAGVFPIFIGKGSHAFNGDVHPLRTAPLYHYVGAVVQALTGGHGSAFVVHNLVMAGSYLLAVGSTFLCLAALAPSRSWLRFALTLLFASGPGLLALAYSGDMVASWMTIPILPVFFFLLVRVATEPDPSARLPALAVACAALWYAHAPIAIWTSALAAPVALARLIQVGITRRSLSRAFLSCGIFTVLTFFLFVSVRDLEIPRSVNVLTDFSGGVVQRNLEAGWRGFLQPVSQTGAQLLSDLQLSPGLWLVFLPAAIAGAGGSGGPAIRLLVAGFALLFLLLVPRPEISGRLWSLVPNAILLPTEKWPMQRFYPIMTALAVILTVRFLPHGTRIPRWRALFGVLVALGVGWSAYEARRFVDRGHTTSTPAEVAFRRLLPENSTLSRYSHEYFGVPTRYFSNSTVDPAYQMRLVNPDTQEPEQSNFDVPTPPSETITLRVEPHASGGARILPNVTLEPGKRYLLTFSFKRSDPSGWIILSGKTFYRDYQLPSSGEERAFGAGPLSAPSIVLATSSSQPESIEINYLWSSGPTAEEVFAQIQFGPEARDQVPFRVTSLIPFRAGLRGLHAGLLLTPRIYYPGYVALVDGREVETRPSQRRMLMVPVEDGANELSLTFVGTPLLRISFWTSLGAWFAVLAWIMIAVRERLIRPEPAKRLGFG